MGTSPPRYPVFSMVPALSSFLDLVGRERLPACRLYRCDVFLVDLPADGVGPARGRFLVASERPSAARTVVAIDKPLHPRDHIVGAVAGYLGLNFGAVFRRSFHWLPHVGSFLISV